MSLDVYLKGQRIGALHPGDGCEYSFAYRPEVVEKFEAGTPLLSYALPVRAEPYGPAEARPFVEGLLPAGRRRAQIAEELEIDDPEEGYALIAALGGDCTGAVTFRPQGSSEHSSASDSIAWLDDDDLEEVVGEEPEWLVDPNDAWRMRSALPGVRHKLALVYDEDEDRWAWPGPGIPSTHIVKPEPDEALGAAYNEMFCSMALREMGLPVAHAEVRTIAGRECLVSRRFDRWQVGDRVQRLHQESFSQALGYTPLDLEHRGPGYAESRELLSAIDEEKEIETLFVASYCRFLIGNEEDHGTNSAILFSRVGPILAPFHDIYAGSFHEVPAPIPSGLDVVRRHSCVASLAPIAIECNYMPQEAFKLGAEVKMQLCEALNSIAERAQAEGWYQPIIDELLSRVLERFKSFHEEVEMFVRPGGGPSGAGESPS